jgi:hypothetical protein
MKNDDLGQGVKDQILTNGYLALAVLIGLSSNLAGIVYPSRGFTSV